MFTGKVAIVTGAATGLGETIAEILFQRGASVTLVDIDRDGARNVAARLDPAGARTLAWEAGVGIRINAIGPGYIETPEIAKLPGDTKAEFAAAHPLGRLGTRREIADTVAFLLSDEASFLTGGFYMADGGLTAR